MMITGTMITGTMITDNMITGAGGLPPLTEQAETANELWDIFFWIAMGIGALVVVLVGIVVIRFRRRDDELPRQIHHHVPFEIFYMAVPLVIVGGLFGITLVALDDFDDEGNAEVDIHVTAFQWQWQFDYPDADVTIVGTEEEPPELVLPTDTTVRFELESVDVVHSFWIPGFRFKRDIFPAETTDFEVDVLSTTGFWENSGVCAEFCGADHHLMKFSVRVVTPDEFDEWLTDRRGGET